MKATNIAHLVGVKTLDMMKFGFKMKIKRLGIQIPSGDQFKEIFS
jgi:hypothetical protein